MDRLAARSRLANAVGSRGHARSRSRAAAALHRQHAGDGLGGDRRACEVAVLDARQRTFCVEGHHYALVVLSDLDEGSVRPYEVHLDGERAWPPDDGRPPSTIHTREHERQRAPRLRLLPRRRSRAPAVHAAAGRSIRLGFGIDALWALSRRLQSGQEEWPDCLLLLGDQVYADETSEETRAFIRARRDTSRPPGRAGRRLRGVRAPLPRGLERPGHPLAARDRAEHDDLRRPRRARRLEHLRGLGARHARDARGGTSASPARSCRTGSTSTSATSPRRSWPRSRCSPSSRAAEDGGPRLREFARAIDREPASSRFAFHRDFGRSRLVVIDSRAARVLAEGRRDMVDDEEWQWIAEHARGAYDHLIIASTLPVFMTPGIDGLEAWNEAVCAGAWGRLAARAGREAPARARPRALARLPALVPDDGRAPARARRGRRTPRARSRSSAATCTRPTSRRSRSASARRAASSRSSARRSGIRCSRASGASSGSSARAPRASSAGRSRAQRRRPAAGRRPGGSSRP